MIRWSRLPGFGFGFVLLLLGAWVFQSAPALFHPGPERVAGFLLLGAGALASWAFFPFGARPYTGGRAAGAILVVCLLPRLLLLDAPLSDDVHRYRWEGRLVLEGRSPYETTADHPSTEPYRDADWERMNHRDRGTVYPPVAMGLFALLASAPAPIPPELAAKAVFLLFDLGTLGLVLSLCRRKRLPLSLSFLYGLNPVVLAAFAGEGHYDSAFVFALVAALWAAEAGRRTLSWVALGLAFQLKVVSAFLVPFWLLRTGFRGSAAGLAVALLPWLFFAGDIPSWLESLRNFGGGTAFNGLVPFLFEGLGLDRRFLPATCASVFLGLLGLVLLKGGSLETLVRRGLMAFLLASPVLHFWYLAWLVPFLALRPSLAWVWLCLAQGVYFLVWRELAHTGAWGLPLAWQAVEWLPFLALGSVEGARLLRRPRVKGQNQGGTPTVGIVVPTLNAAPTLPACLASIAGSDPPPDEVVVVDAGSNDGTDRIAHGAGHRVIQAPRGRGAQIEAGIRALETDFILVLHADCEIHPRAVRAVQAMPGEVVGGGCGQRFAVPDLALTIVEAMNEGRAVLGESYWGDQGMFLRKSARRAWEGLADFPLMEDVELSRRLRRLGETRYLGLETRAGTAKWGRSHRWKRVWIVFSFVIRFRLAALTGRHARLAATLYRRYYGE